MNFLFLSVLVSPSVLVEAHEKDPTFNGYAVQKFSRLVAEGLVKNGASVTSLSSFYLPNIRRFWFHKKEMVDGVIYKYIPSTSCGIIRRVWLIIYSFGYVFFWGLWDKKNKAIVCDMQPVSICTGAVFAARLLGLHRIGIMTDMPGLKVNQSKNKTHNSMGSLPAKFSKLYYSHFTHYVFLTEQMNDVVNTNNRPYIVMEGLVDSNLDVPSIHRINDTKVVLYAGGLNERYGLRLLVEGFIKADVDNSELRLYGDGPFVDELLSYSRRDSRIIYMGIQPNEVIIEAEQLASLLVNPRPTHEEFTKYSFPSKNMEYMVSGTPLLTTRLPGMPQEYYPYVYLFEEESVEGYAIKIKEILLKDRVDLEKMGLSASKFVLEQKNNIKQCARIINLLSNGE